MQLTRFTDLGMRAMMLLATGEADDRRVTTRVIANSANASEHHVAKAVSRLTELGMVTSRRGRVGGLNLTESGRSASVGWLIRALEGDRAVIECEGDAPCPLIAGCRLRRALARAKEAFYRELDAYNVADLVRETSLPLIFGISPAIQTPSAVHTERSAQ